MRLQAVCSATPLRRRSIREVIGEHPTISRATVYRNLNCLSQMGHIRRLEISGGLNRFDHLCHQHYHIRCEKCGCAFDADMDCIPDLEKNIRNNYGFPFTGYDILFRGICPEWGK